MDDIKLPPLPAAPWPHLSGWNKDEAAAIEAWGRAAVLADREARGEPVAYRVKLAEPESGVRHAYAENPYLLAYLGETTEKLYAAPQPASEPRVEFTTTAPAQRHSVSLAEAARLLAGFLQEFPGGLEEMRSVMAQFSAQEKPDGNS